MRTAICKSRVDHARLSKPKGYSMKALFLGAALCALSLAGAAFGASLPDYVAKAVADPSRPKTDSVRDPLRAPGETIAFVGVKPGMVVAELFPSGGYYTRMIS